MSVIEAGARGAEIALLLLLAAMCLRDARGYAAARYGALFLLGAAANAVSSAPALGGHLHPWLVPFRILALGNPAMFWIVASALFDDDFRPGWPQGLAWLGLEGFGLWAGLHGGQRLFLPENWIALACLLAAVWQAIRGGAEDLVEARRQFRVVFVVSVGLFTTAIIGTAMLSDGGAGLPSFGYIDSFGSFGLAVFFTLRLLMLRPDALFLPLGSPIATPAAIVTKPAEAPVDPQETFLLAALEQQMGEHRAYREAALNIGALAARLGIPEYRLRRLINQRLGHRNFSAFLNGYRLDEAMEALADASQADVPILTIALDAGFNSLGPFNRAFKARAGMTPTDYRRLKGS